MKRILLILLAFCLLSNANALAQNRGLKMLALARKGDVAAMRIVSAYYVAGCEGLQRNKAKGLFWAKKAAQKGDIKAMNNVAMLVDDVREKGEDSEKLYWALQGAKRYDATSEVITAEVYQLLGILMEKSASGDYEYKYSEEKRKEFLQKAIKYAQRAKSNYYTTSEITRNAQHVINLSVGPLSSLGVEFNWEELGVNIN